MSKKLAINSLASEKQTVYRFVLLYTLFSVTILAFTAFIHFKSQKESMLAHKRITLQEWSNELIVRLKKLHIDLDKTNVYPRDERFESAIFDSDGVEIFATDNNFDTELDKVIYEENNLIYFIREPESYYLGAKYIILQIKDDGLWLKTLLKNASFYAFFLVLFVAFMGYFLLRLLISPMKNAMFLLDSFIKDTTHELNTPISAILINIETLEDESFSPKIQKKLERIKIAAKTISNLYEDLTYALLNNKLQSKNELLDIAQIAKERVEYFSSMANMKHIELSIEIKNHFYFEMDCAKLTKLIDNLISNAIKYNKPSGYVKVLIEDKSIIVIDNGIGIQKENLKKAFERYSRFDTSKGGFGIGLSIVKMIASEYHLHLELDSKENLGTTIKVNFNII